MSAHRISTNPSESHVRVEANGQVLAESDRAIELHETGLPTRYYLPREDVRMELLTLHRHHLALPVQGRRLLLLRPRGQGRVLGLRGAVRGGRQADRRPARPVARPGRGDRRIAVPFIRMRILVTGSSGHLGEALCRVLRPTVRTSSSIDVLPSAHTTSSARSPTATLVRAAHARASTPCCTPRRCTSRTSARTRRQDFVDTNVTGTLNLLEEAVAAGVGALRLHQHHQRLRPRADAAAGRARGLDHRGRRARSRRTSTA